MRILPLALVLAMVAGCARYEFDITRPGAESLTVDNQAQSRFEEIPFIYRAVAKENRLVLMIQNTLATPVELLGEKSAVVDPNGQSHPLRSQTIAPQAFIRLVLPPLRPRFEQGGGAFSIGVQAGMTRQQPIYLDYYSDVDATYWDWDGQSTVRLLLTYRSADGKTWSHEFSLYKRKA